MAVTPEQAGIGGDEVAGDEPAGHPPRHEPYGRHQDSKNYRQIMDARSVVDGGRAALAARPPCGLLTGEAPGPCLAREALGCLLRLRCGSTGFRGLPLWQAAGPPWLAVELLLHFNFMFGRDECAKPYE